MRPLIPTFLALALLLAAPAAFAAPTCQDKNGDGMKCGTPGAMPVGWTLSPQQISARQKSRPTDQNMHELLEVICGLGVFLALIALMPEFDGSRAADWGKQEGDDDERE